MHYSAAWRRPGELASAHAVLRAPPQRLPANQRAPEREERLVDVGPLVVADAQASELVEPCKRPLDHPPSPAQPTPVRRTTHSDPRHNMPHPQPTPNRCRVVAAIPEHTGRSLPRSPACAVQRRNRIHQRQGFLRVVPVRAGQAHRERHALPVADQMALAPAFGPVGGVRTGLVTAVHRADGTTLHDRPRPMIWCPRASQSKGPLIALEFISWLYVIAITRTVSATLHPPAAREKISLSRVYGR